MTDWWLQPALLGNAPLRLAVAALLFVASGVALSVVRGVAVRRVTTWTERTTTRLDDVLVAVLGSVRPAFLWLLAAWFATRVLTLDASLDGALRTVAILVGIVQVGWSANVGLQALGTYYRDREEVDGGRRTTIAAFTFLGRLLLYVVVLLLVLENLGVDITALLAGIGIGAVAIGLALQNILGDLFASLSILFDKPFEIGDFVVVDDLSGTIENVGLRTTRVRALSGEQLVFANADLLQSRIRNYKRMRERRAVIALGVTYDTPSERLRELPDVIREVVEAQDGVRFERAHFKTFGPSSLDFEVVYWVLEPDYATYMDVNEAIHLGLFEAFAARGVEFAFPTRTLHLVGAGGPDAGPAPAPATAGDGA
ncbi:MAG: mechanosensitive ion channel family protein [Trueperaceae bacterium]|nr:mechanosensitive ion channel family protein [Trueperaceae bacterium]